MSRQLSSLNFLGQKLRGFRVGLNYTLHEMAILLDIDSTLINKFENGSRIPSKERLLKYANQLSIDVEYLISLQKTQIIINKLGINNTTIMAIRNLLILANEKEKNDQ